MRYIRVWLWLSRGTGKRSAICGGSSLPVSLVNDAITETILTAVTWHPWGVIFALRCGMMIHQDQCSFPPIVQPLLTLGINVLKSHRRSRI